MRSNVTRRRLRSEGNCIECGDPAEPFWRCKDCRKHRADEANERRRRKGPGPKGLYRCGKCKELGHQARACRKEE